MTMTTTETLSPAQKAAATRKANLLRQRQNTSAAFADAPKNTVAMMSSEIDQHTVLARLAESHAPLAKSRISKYTGLSAKRVTLALDALRETKQVGSDYRGRWFKATDEQRKRWAEASRDREHAIEAAARLKKSAFLAGSEMDVEQRGGSVVVKLTPEQAERLAYLLK